MYLPFLTLNNFTHTVHQIANFFIWSKSIEAFFDEANYEAIFVRIRYIDEFLAVYNTLKYEL
jgi:hypothetical protein